MSTAELVARWKALADNPTRVQGLDARVRTYLSALRVAGDALTAALEASQSPKDGGERGLHKCLWVRLTGDGARSWYECADGCGMRFVATMRVALSARGEGTKDAT